MGDGHTSELKSDFFVRVAVEVDRIAIIMPHGARKAHLRSSYVGDATKPSHLGDEELGLVAGLNGTAIDQAGLAGCARRVAQMCECGRGWLVVPRKF